jgi:hypothetical protein
MTGTIPQVIGGGRVHSTTQACIYLHTKTQKRLISMLDVKQLAYCNREFKHGINMERK